MICTAGVMALRLPCAIIASDKLGVGVRDDHRDQAARPTSAAVALLVLGKSAGLIFPRKVDATPKAAVRRGNEAFTCD